MFETGLAVGGAVSLKVIILMGLLQCFKNGYSQREIKHKVGIKPLCPQCIPNPWNVLFPKKCTCHIVMCILFVS